MIRKVFVLLMICIMSYQYSFAQFKPSIYTFTLSNGLNVVLNRDTSFQEVALYLFANAGFSKEQPGQYGIAHLFEHAMLPTRYYLNKETTKGMAAHVINTNAQVSNDFARYYIQLGNNGLDYGLVALADRLDYQVDSLKEEQVQRHINNVANELARQQSSTSFRWQPAFKAAQAKGVFGALHPYGHDQSFMDISRATRKDLNNWFKQFYGAKNATLVVLGNIDSTGLHEKMKRYFGGIEPGKTSVTEDPGVPIHHQARKADISLSQSKHLVYYAWPIPGYGTVENDYFTILSTLLTDPSMGILTQALRNAGLEGNALSKLETYKYAAVFDIGVEFSDPEKRHQITSILEKVIKDIMTRSMPVTNIHTAVARYELALAKGMEDIGQQGDRIVELAAGSIFLNDAIYFQHRISNLRKMLPTTLRSAISKWLKCPPFVGHITGAQVKAEDVYNYKNTIGPFPIAAITLPSIQKKPVSDRLTMYLANNNRIPVVDFVVSYENEYGLSTEQLVKYERALTAHFETGPVYQQLVAHGIQTTTQVSGKMLSYKVSCLRPMASDVYAWMSTRINLLKTLPVSATASSEMYDEEQSLSFLKEQVMGAQATPDNYPVSAIHLIIAGDLKNIAFDHSVVNAMATKLFGPPSSLPIKEATYFIKDIGETSNSFLTLGHAASFKHDRDLLHQQVMLQLLRAKLMANLREKNGLVYEVYPFTTTPITNGTMAYWQMSIPVEKTDRTIDEIEKELLHLTESTPGQFDNAKARMIGELKEKFRSLTSTENAIIEMIEYKVEGDYFAKAIQVAQEISWESLKEFLDKYAKPDHFKLALFTSPKISSQLNDHNRTLIRVSK